VRELITHGRATAVLQQHQQEAMQKAEMDLRERTAALALERERFAAEANQRALCERAEAHGGALGAASLRHCR
jgi:hypothetical protein